MAEDAAFFRFDSNADAVAADIAGAMARINSTLAKPIASPELGRNTAGLGQLFGKMEGELTTGVGRVKNLLASGASPEAFQSEFKKIVRSTVGTIPQTMANELALAPKAVAGRVDVRGIARGIGKDYVDTLLQTVRAGGGDLGKVSSRNFFNDLQKVQKAPAAYGQESSAIAQLRNQLRAEELLRRDPALGSGTVGLARDQGFSQQFMTNLQDRTTVDSTRGKRFVGSGAVEELRGLEAAQRSQTAATAAEEKAVLRDAAAFERYAASLTRADLAAQKGAIAQHRVGERNEKAAARTQATAARQAEATAATQARQTARQEEISRRQGAKYDANNAGFASGAVTRLSRGGVSPLTNLGTQVASAASFSIGYGALFGGLAAAKDTLSEFLDYQDSLTDLEVATRSTDVVTNEFVDDLSDMSRMVGENLGSSLDTAARGIRAFGDPLTDTKEDLQDIGLAANEAANKLALVAGKSLKDATGDAVAVGTAYGLQPDQLLQITDAVANAKKLGADAGQISQGLASISTASESAGFSVDQAAALVSLVQSRTDESGQAVATRLTKIFQVVSGSTGKRLGQELGVDTNQSVRKQLEDYAKIYTDPNTTKATKDRISSSLGGTANLKELLPVLQEGAALQQAYGDAAANAGQGTSEFERKSGNLVGTLKKITGDVKNIQVDLARTGLLSPFGVLIETLEPVLQLLDRMLKLFNSLPAPIKTTAAGLADVAIAAKAVAIIQTARAGALAPALAEQALSARQAATLGPVALGAAAPVAGIAATGAKAEIAAATAAQAAGFQQLTATRAQTAGIAIAGEQRLAAEAVLNRGIASTAVVRAGEETAAGAASIGMIGGLKSIGKTLINPVTIGIGALVGGAILLNKVMTGFDQRKQFLQTYGATSNALGRTDGSSASLFEAAKDFKAASGEIAKSDSNFVSKGEQKRYVADLDAQGKDLTILAKRVAIEERATAAKGSADIFGSGGVISTVDELGLGLSRLSESGVTATEQMRLLQVALNETAAPDKGQRFDPTKLAGLFGANALGAVQDALPEVITRARKRQAYSSYSGGSLGTTDTLTETIAGKSLLPDIREANSSVDLADAYAKAAASLNIKKGDVLTAQQKGLLISKAVGAFDLSALGDEAEQTRVNIREKLLAQEGLFDISGSPGHRDGTKFRGRKTASAITDLINGPGALNKGQLLSILQGSPDGKRAPLLDLQQAALTALPSSDDGTQKRAVLKRNLDLLRTLQSRGRKSGTNIGTLNLAVKNAEDTYATAKVEEINELRRVAQNDVAGNKKKVRAVGLASLQSAIKAAGDNPRLLKEIMADANQGSLAVVRATLAAAAEVAAEARRMQQRIARVAADLVNTAASLFGGELGTSKPKKIPKTDAERRLAAFDAAEKGSNIAETGGVYATGSDAVQVADAEAAAKKKKDKEKKDKKDKDDRTAAQKAAQAAQGRLNPDDTVGSARVDLQLAQADFAAAKKGSEEYYSSMQAVSAARNSLGDAIRSRSAAIAKSLIDPDQTVRAARVDLQLALTNLAGATRGTEEFYTALGAVTQSRDALAKAEAEKIGAQAGVRGARVGGGLASSRAELTAAAATLRATAKGTTGYFQGLAAFYNAQRSMREALLAYKTNRDQLRGDITDPVENARDALREARRKLRQDRRTGQGKDVIAEDRVGERTAENALQASKFEQRFSDAQTAEQLGRLSFAKYMNYLDHEHERLSKIKNRTRQQQDQLDQVDGAMKSALDAMDSQFNLGDINTNGLVYQVRRFQAESRAGAAASQLSNSVTQNQNVRIEINGADTGKVKSILDTYLKIEGGQRQSLTRRKV